MEFLLQSFIFAIFVRIVTETYINFNFIPKVYEVSQYHEKKSEQKIKG